jgi:hypothetical protein
MTSGVCIVDSASGGGALERFRRDPEFDVRPYTFLSCRMSNLMWTRWNDPTALRVWVGPIRELI